MSLKDYIGKYDVNITENKDGSINFKVKRLLEFSGEWLEAPNYTIPAWTMEEAFAYEKKLIMFTLSDLRGKADRLQVEYEKEKKKRDEEERKRLKKSGKVSGILSISETIGGELTLEE